MPESDYRTRARQRAAQREQGQWFKLKEGDNTFRILPTPKSDTSPDVYTEYLLHREVGARKKAVRCGKDAYTNKGKCWLCDVQIPKLESTKPSRAAALEPGNVFVVQIAKVNDEDGTMKGPFLFSPSKKVTDQLLASVIGSKRRDYVDAKKGYNITLSRTGEGLATRYGMLEPDTDSSVVPAEIIKKLKAFSALKDVPKYSEQEQKAAYFNKDEDTRGGKQARRSRDVEEDEDEDEEEDDVEESEDDEDVEDTEEDTDSEDGDEPEDEEEEDEKPASKKKPRPAAKKVAAKKTGKKKPPVEEEEEDEPEDDEAEDDDAEADEDEDVPDDLDVEDDDVPDDDEDDEEEEPAPPKRAAKKTAAAKKKTRR